jgi:Bles03-like protein
MWQYVQLVQPTKALVSPWVRAERYWYAPAYPKSTERCGKWMVYIPIDRVDAVWSIVRDATVIGELGRAAKVATMAENPRAVYEDKKVIGIFTYDSDDLEDIDSYEA